MQERRTKALIYNDIIQRNAVRRRSAIARWRKRTKIVRWVKLVSTRARKQHASQLKGRAIIKWSAYVKKTRAARFEKCKKFLSKTDDVRQLLVLHTWATAARRERIIRERFASKQHQPRNFFRYWALWK